MTASAPTLDGFPAILARAWVWGRRLLWLAALLATAMIVLNGIHLYGLLGEVHPWVARSVAGVLVLVLSGWAAWSVARYLRTPRVLTPPDLPAPEAGWTRAQRAAYRRFAVRYLERQRRNPHLPDEARERIPAAIAAIAVDASVPEAEDDAVAATALVEIVEGRLEAVLAPLDERANRLIRRAAVEVAAATAVSPSILLDSLITLTRNLDLISRLADLYYGRPGLLGTARIARDVIGSAVAAGALEAVSEHVSGALAEMTGSWSSRLIGPIGQGMINGVVTMRFGAATKYRCRSLARRKVPWRPWRLGQYRRAFGTLARWISEEMGPTVLSPLQRFATWTERTTESTVEGGKKLLRKVAGAVRGKGETEAEIRPSDSDTLSDDPLLDSSLIG